jgi:transcriptional regulator with XRE-family HTH domain
MKAAPDPSRAAAPGSRTVHLPDAAWCELFSHLTAVSSTCTFVQYNGYVTDLAVLGRNVRRIRNERQLSLSTLAAQAGVAKQTLANLESGHGNPTAQTVFAVAGALGIGASTLMTEWDSPLLVRRGAAAHWTDETWGRSRTLDQIYGTGQVVTTLIEVSAARSVRPASPPGTLHHAYVIAGTALIGPVEHLQLLEPGDFIRFAGEAPHVIRAGQGNGALVHLVTTIPKVQQFTVT